MTPGEFLHLGSDERQGTTVSRTVLAPTRCSELTDLLPRRPELDHIPVFGVSSSTLMLPVLAR